MKLHSLYSYLAVFIWRNYFEIHHIVVCINSLFLFNLMDVPQFLIHSPSGEHLGHFQLLVITDKAVMNPELYVCVDICFPFS